jgi:hypothetical protein
MPAAPPDRPDTTPPPGQRVETIQDRSAVERRARLWDRRRQDIAAQVARAWRRAIGRTRTGHPARRRVGRQRDRPPSTGRRSQRGPPAGHPQPPADLHLGAQASLAMTGPRTACVRPRRGAGAARRGSRGRRRSRPRRRPQHRARGRMDHQFDIRAGRTRKGLRRLGVHGGGGHRLHRTDLGAAQIAGRYGAARRPCGLRSGAGRPATALRRTFPSVEQRRYRATEDEMHPIACRYFRPPAQPPRMMSQPGASGDRKSPNDRSVPLGAGSHANAPPPRWRAAGALAPRRGRRPWRRPRHHAAITQPSRSHHAANRASAMRASKVAPSGSTASSNRKPGLCSGTSPPCPTVK